MITNEEFMENLERDYPGEDWDAVPDPATLPDIYEVHGWKWAEVGPPWKRTMRKQAFAVVTEYKTYEEAQAQVERCKTWEGIVPEEIEIRALKPSDAVWKHFDKECRERILKGEKVFPMYLP